MSFLCDILCADSTYCCLFFCLPFYLSIYLSIPSVSYLSVYMWIHLNTNMHTSYTFTTPWLFSAAYNPQAKPFCSEVITCQLCLFLAITPCSPVLAPHSISYPTHTQRTLCNRVSSAGYPALLQTTVLPKLHVLKYLGKCTESLQKFIGPHARTTCTNIFYY